MLSRTYRTCVITSLVMMQQIGISSIESNSEPLTDSSIPEKQYSAAISNTSTSLQKANDMLVATENSKQKLIAICHRMHAKTKALTQECSQLESENTLLLEQLAYQKTNPCPWAVIAANISGKSIAQLESICNGIPVQNSSRKKRATRKKGQILRETPLEPSDPALASSLTDVGFALKNAEKHEDAEPFFAWALMITHTEGGGNHLATAIALKNLAGLYLDMNAYTKAESAYRRTLSEFRYVFDDDHHKFAAVYNMLAASLKGQKRYVEAEGMYLKSIATYESVYGRKSYRLIAPINNLAQLYLDMSRYDSAEQCLNRALSLMKHDKKHIYMVYVDDNIRRLKESISDSERGAADTNSAEMTENKTNANLNSYGDLTQ